MKERLIIGSDEVGYGALAGPLFVVGVAMPRMWKFPGLRDSKKISAPRRIAMFDSLTEAVRGRWSLAIRTHAEIDKRGVRTCLLEAHTSVLLQLLHRFPDAEEVIADGDLVLPNVPHVKSIPKADDLFPVVSAASVIAKVLRDEEMELCESRFPGYGFAIHKGYGTPFHLECLKEKGLCPIHRQSYKLFRFLPRTS